jgi:predicted nucleotidyltransferase
MVEKTVLSVVRKYLKELSMRGIPVKAAVIFGSYATGRPHEWSDIDLLIISPHFDKKFRRKDIDLLWHVAADVDSRIEPIAVGERQYQENRTSYIIDEARRKGFLVPLAE